MPRPTKNDVTEKRLAKVFGELKLAVDNDSAARLTVRELVFARLVAEEGFTYSDAYVEAFAPSETATKDSIHQMSSRVAARHRVRAEMDRIRRTLEEEKLSREAKLAIALDGAVVRDRMAIELFAMATSDLAPQFRIKAWDMLGNMKHVDAFAKANVSIDSSKMQINNFGIKPEATVDEAKMQVMDQLRRMISAPASTQTIDAPAIREIVE